MTYQFCRKCGVRTFGLGKRDLALSAHGRVFDVGPVDVQKSTTLRATYASRRGVRIAGWITLFVGALVGGVMMASAIHESNCPVEKPCTGGLDNGVFFGGLAVAGVGTLAGMLMALTKDHAGVVVEPSSSLGIARVPLAF